MKKTPLETTCYTLKSLLKKGVENGVYSGAAVGLYFYEKGHGEKRIVTCGTTAYKKFSSQIGEKTFFDLASLTKPLCTALAILYLVNEHKISLDTEITTLWRSPKACFLKNIKIRHLLSHSSGLPSYVPLYEEFDPIQNETNKEILLKKIFQQELLYPPGSQCLYSDLGFMLLGEIIEKLSATSLDRFFAAEISGALGLEKEIFFRPKARIMSVGKSQFAATQHCPWRQRLLQGEVDDEHCWLMNGVAGHAGLFGTIKGVLDLTGIILDQWQGRGEYMPVSKSLLRKALHRQYPDQTWCLGFDTPSDSGSSAGRYMAKESVGHLGFTGTSFWIDPVNDLVIVLLTNRVHPDRQNNQIKDFRPVMHDAVMQTLQSGLNKKSP